MNCTCGDDKKGRRLKRFEGTLAGSTQVGPDTRILTFSIPHLSLPPRPGQFFMVKTFDPGFPLFGRAFSVFDFRSGVGSDEVEFLVSAVGRGTTLLTAAAPGSAVLLIGPLGNGFPSVPERRELILVGGGTGVAAFHLLMKETTRRGADPAGLCLLQGARTAESLYARDRFEALPFDVEVSTDDGSLGTPGLVDALLAARLARKPAGDRTWIFACGPDPMMRAVAAVGEKEEIPTFLSLESRMACGTGVCNGCAVPVEKLDGKNRVFSYQRTCCEGPVFLSLSLPTFRRPDNGKDAI
jgi:dihydroorotate dehydrogenase electron transfer subunit